MCVFSDFHGCGGRKLERRRGGLCVGVAAQKVVAERRLLFSLHSRVVGPKSRASLCSSCCAPRSSPRHRGVCPLPSPLHLFSFFVFPTIPESRFPVLARTPHPAHSKLFFQNSRREIYRREFLPPANLSFCSLLVATPTLFFRAKTVTVFFFQAGS